LQEKIYELNIHSLKDKKHLQNIISNDKVNYYWSLDWSEEFYIEQAQNGFISTSHDHLGTTLLLPEIQFEYALLNFKDLHISSKVAKLIKREDFKLSFDNNFNTVLKNIQNYHKYNWLQGPYLKLMQKLHTNQDKYQHFKLHSVELLSKSDNKLIAGEIGYVIGSTYTSLTGYSSKEKRYNNCGKLQLVYLAQTLEEQGFDFWNLGHPHMEYKKHLGAKVYSRQEFLKRWTNAISKQQRNLYE